MSTARPRRRTRTVLTLILIAVAALLYTAPPRSSVAAAGDSISAIYRDGTLRVSIPYDESIARSRNLRVEVLSPDDKPVAEATRPVASARETARWEVSVGLPPKMALEDLVWHRVRIGTKIVSLSEILRLPVVRLLAQGAYAAGSRASLRVVAAESKSGDPLRDSRIKLELVNGETSERLFEGETDAHGTAEVMFTVPPAGFGSRTLRVTAETPLGVVTANQPVQIERRNKILLTTDKPLYQPGQTIHLRALALDASTRAAATDQPLTLEIEDAKGNKVFKRRGRTDRFGIASADFDLADEVNFGPYHVRAILGEDAAVYTQEKTVTVDRYVLPKFKVEIVLGKDAGREQQSFYSPGETVEGKVTARYLFGKPLVNAGVTVVLKSFDVEASEIGRINGKTDAEGRFSFSSKLPDFLAGRSTQQGSAPVSVGVEIKDTADHTETKSRDILVSNTPILIMAVPESGQLLPGLENRVFVLTSYPDGRPAETTVSGELSGSPFKTDESGVAVVPVRAATGAMQFKLKAADSQGRAGEATVTLEARSQPESLMLRTGRAVLKVGDKLRLETISTRARGAVYVDVVKDGQTLLTRALETEEGRGRLDVDLTPEMFGAVEVRAYQFTSDADPITDRRLVYVDPADDLRIAVSAARDSYKPGEDARLEFRATDAAGRPVSAALGVEIVDEAVFALSDKQPGFEKVFMHLQKELLTPRYEVHQFSFEQVVLDDFQGEAANRTGRRERAAEVLLAAAGTVTGKDVRGVYGREPYEVKRQEYSSLYTRRVAELAQALVPAMTKYYEVQPPSKEGFGRDLRSFASTETGRNVPLTDPWGNPVNGDGAFSAIDTAVYFSLRSNGPDGRQATADDITVPVLAQRDGPLERIRATRFKGSATVEEGVVGGGGVQVVGAVKDEHGTPVVGVKVLAARVSDGKAVWVYTDAEGSFAVAELPPGNYRVTFESEAHHTTTYKTLALVAGARGRVETMLATRGPRGVRLSLYGSYFGGNSAVAETVTVAADGGGRGGFEARRIKELPLNARRAEALMLQAPAAKATAPADMLADDRRARGADAKNEEGDGAGPRVRSFFPETLYTNPALITDGDGRASVNVPLADSITTWRVTSLASTAAGALGSSTAPLRVFQDFFVDLDLPVSVTQGDEVAVPVVVYNYLSSPQSVSLELRQDDWFTLEGGDTAYKQVEVGAGEVTVAHFRLKASKIGDQQLQVTGRLGGSTSGTPSGDAVARNLTVVPNGEERLVVHNERLEGSATKEVSIPEEAIPDASKIFVKFYPGALSQMVEGLDSILRMPGGCFEQTSSSTYPNVLVLDYLKTSKKLTPEIQAKAEGYISLGYQKLVTFEVKGGGFSWFGNDPANKILTAYGLMEFSDMSRVHEVDPRVIERTQTWLASQQQPDGSFKPDTYFINEGATTRYNTDLVRITAYIGWALASTGYKGEAVEKAKQYVRSHTTGKEDAYTLAVIANFAADSGTDKGWTESAVGTLASKARDDGKLAFWKQEGETPTSAREDSADLETTALAVQALLKAGQGGGLAKKGLDYLTSKKDALGNWQTTQATILALKAFLLSHTRGSNTDTEGTISVSVDGRPAGSVQVTRDNNDLLQLVDLKQFTHAGANRIALTFNGRGSMQYQIVGRYYVPWSRVADGGGTGRGAEPLSIDLTYDRTRLAQDETVTTRVRVQNNTAAKAKMVMIDLGIPPGFEPLGEDFAELLDTTRGKLGGKIEKYTITAKQVILYLDGLNARQSVDFNFRLRAKFPLRAQTFPSRVYEYYNPGSGDSTKPLTLSVTAK
ncbi:MAG TPA: MG2 domain-containing protein [Pyrinomonadaceae bacterium]